MKKKTLLQFFHWYYPEGGKLWNEVAEKAPYLDSIGISAVWLPPAYKGASGGYSVGYDSYDLFDLGEFDQKGSVATKYGDKQQLLQACQTLHDNNLAVIHDVVFNHKMGADDKEQIKVRRADSNDRNNIDEEEIEALVYTKFTFPARKGKYSKFQWDFRCFSGVDYIEFPDSDESETGVYKIVNDFSDEGWNDEVDGENGNYDYLMGADIDFRNEAVSEELKFWGRWMMDEVPCDGFRLDAVKHIPAWFFNDWVSHIRADASRDLMVVAEYWSFDIDALTNYLDQTGHQLMLFDAPLQLKFHLASKSGNDFDMSQIFTDTLVEADPFHAVTITANHDTQPMQALEAPVEPWFKPLAYALILLRENGTPCLFYPDLFGAEYSDTGHDGQEHNVEMVVIEELEKLVQARQLFANGPQHDFFDDPNCIAFVREGTDQFPGCVVIMTNGDEAGKEIDLGEGMKNKVFCDYLGKHENTITTDDEGKATFTVNAGSVSVWVVEDRIE